MRWAKPITKNWNKREKRIEEAIRNQSLKENRKVVKDFVQKDVIEDTVFPMNQDVGLEMAEDFMVKNGDKIAVGLYNTGTKQFGGTNISSAFYAGSKMVGAAGKAMPLIGAAVDFGSMVASGESDADAAAKTGAHLIANIGIGLAIGALGVTGLGAIALGAVVTLGVTELVIDPLYDVTKKEVGDAVKSVGKWVGNLFG
ncbi:hypothetical protein [Enterococcus rivorum]|nr:hypothetical protein [Enterococcus rivorum]MBP2099832.1 hypothetical protein [Enterococcus rivorum]